MIYKYTNVVSVVTTISSVVKCYQNWSIKPCCKEESKPVKTGYFIIHKRNLLKCSLPLDQSIVNDH